MMATTACQAKPVQRRKLDFHDFGTPVLEIERLHRFGYRKAGNWDLRQMCEHLALVMEGTLDGFAFAPWSFVWRRIFGPIAIRYTVWTRGMKQGLQCPAPSFAPRPQGDVTEAVERCKRAFQRVAVHQGEFHAHPVLGYIKPEDWRQIHLIHAAHHLSFLVPNDSDVQKDAEQPCARSN